MSELTIKAPKTKRYVIQFNNESGLDVPTDCPFGFTNRQKAIDRARVIFKYKESYTNEYTGGTLAVIDTTNNSVIWVRAIW